MDYDFYMFGLCILFASAGIFWTEPDSFGMKLFECNDDIEVFIAGDIFLSFGDCSRCADCCLVWGTKYLSLYDASGTS